MNTKNLTYDIGDKRDNAWIIYKVTLLVPIEIYFMYVGYMGIHNLGNTIASAFGIIIGTLILIITGLTSRPTKKYNWFLIPFIGITIASSVMFYIVTHINLKKNEYVELNGTVSFNPPTHVWPTNKLIWRTFELNHQRQEISGSTSYSSMLSISYRLKTVVSRNEYGRALAQSFNDNEIKQKAESKKQNAIERVLNTVPPSKYLPKQDTGYPKYPRLEELISREITNPLIGSKTFITILDIDSF